MDEAAPSLFLLEPTYADFKPGKSRLKLSTFGFMDGCFAVFALLAMFSMCMVSLITAESSWAILSLQANATIDVARIAMLLFLLFVGGGFLFFAWAFWQYVRAVFHYERINKKAQILDGILVSTKITHEGKTNAPFLTVTYSFTAPDGSRISAKQQRYEPYIERPIPTPNTPVHVLYVDRWTYVML